MARKKEWLFNELRISCNPIQKLGIGEDAENIQSPEETALIITSKLKSFLEPKQGREADLRFGVTPSWDGAQPSFLPERSPRLNASSFTAGQSRAMFGQNQILKVAFDGLREAVEIREIRNKIFFKHIELRIVYV